MLFGKGDRFAAKSDQLGCDFKKLKTLLQALSGGAIGKGLEGHVDAGVDFLLSRLLDSEARGGLCFGLQVENLGPSLGSKCGDIADNKSLPVIQITEGFSAAVSRPNVASQYSC